MVFRVTTSRRHQDRQGRYCDAEEAQRFLHHAYKWSSILQATKPLLPPDLFICGKIHRRIDHNEMLQRKLAQSTKLLRDAAHIAIGEGNTPAPQAVRPLAPAMPNAPISPLDWKQLCSSKCPGPPRRRMLPAKITRHKVYFQRTILKHFRARLHSRLKRHPPTVATRHWTCSKFPRY
jgi:hypothetical protein